ncbi:excinuclease ABC subunit UvrC [Chloroflexota bacterium]
MEAGHLEEQLKALPTRPGVYLLRDRGGNILYVGKATKLLHRVRSYFGAPSALPLKIQRMVAQVGDFDFFVTDSEQEALILECNLIKKYRPHYNVRLKDDKTYPYLKISLSEPWPRVYITRRLEKDRERYFGPFASASSVRRTLSLLRKLFPFRTCTLDVTGTDSRPCLEYHIQRCLGPCIGAVTQEDYAETIKQVILFLEGRQEALVRELRRKMAEAARCLDFEQAASLRDQIQAVEGVLEGQKIAAAVRGEQDAIAFARFKDLAYVQVFYVRGGKLTGREPFVLQGAQGETSGQIMTSFIKQFYDSASYIPPLILLQHPVDDAAVIARWLRGKRGARVLLQVPRQGDKRQLVQMVAENARHGLEQFRARQLAAPDALAAALEELEEELHLPHIPQRVECYDISDLRGTSAVGSMVVFEQGRPKPSHYRRFKIKTVGGADDCAMIREVLRRRFGRYRGVGEGGLSSRDAWSITPDLVLIDGGRGQLNAALEVMQEAGLDLPVASLAKEKEEVFLPQEVEPIMLPRNSPALYLLQRVRDEAHRFALGYHRRVRHRESLTSALDAIPGIGPKRKRALLQRFGSVRAIGEAPAEELAAVVGMTRSLAEKLKEYL